MTGTGIIPGVERLPSLREAARNTLILLALLGLILAPRPAAGFLDLRSARRLEAAGDHAGAACAWLAAARRIPWQPDLYEQAGHAWLNGGDPHKAEEAYLAALQRDALSPDGWAARGQAAFLQGEVERAVAIWEETLARGIEPSPLLYAGLAESHRQQGDLPAAIQAWESFLSVRPGEANAHYRLGLLLAATAPEGALPDLMRAAQLDPRLDPAVQELRTALNTALLEDDPAYRFLLSGRALGALGEWDLAEAAFRRALAERRDYAEAWAWLAEAEQQQGRDGRPAIERALALDPETAMIQGLYGLYLQRQGRTQEALQAYQKAAALEPGESGWQMALGGLYELDGDLVTAYGHYLGAVQLAPGEAHTWRALALFSLRNSLDLVTTGLPAARRLLELAGDDWQSYDIAGQVLLETGDPPGAEVIFKKALALDPTQAAPALHLALLSLQTGDRAAAYSYLNQARVFDPEGPYGWQAARLLEQYFP